MRLGIWFHIPSVGTVTKGELFVSGWRNLRPRGTVACCGDGYFSALVISCKKHFERRKLPKEKNDVLKKMNRKRNCGRDGKRGMGRERGNVSEKKLLQGLYLHSSHIPQLGMCFCVH